MMTHVMRFVRDEDGATALEYGLLAALIAAALVVSARAVGNQVIGTFAGISAALQDAALVSGSGSGSGSGS